MSDVIWHWTRGNINIFTRRMDIAEEAKQDGEFVMSLKNKPHIFVHTHL